MLGSAEIVTAVADILEERARGIPLVLDPVLASTSGTPLLDDDGIVVMQQRLFPITALLTPNIPEAERLTGTTIHETPDMPRVGEKLARWAATPFWSKEATRRARQWRTFWLTKTAPTRSRCREFPAVARAARAVCWPLP